VKLSLIAVGRLKDGPERLLVERYRLRILAMAPSLGCSGLDISELPEGRGRREDERRGEEAAAIAARIGKAATIVFDERARSMGSEAFAARLRDWRDGGRAAVACIIGGPDGLDAALRDGADLTVSFGGMTMPHGIVRVLVAEQIYRALTIMAGHPYHRGGGDAR
jgi:23S rRNA (pseudouridine1915-N3)-methyltransferase